MSLAHGLDGLDGWTRIFLLLCSKGDLSKYCEEVYNPWVSIQSV